MVNIFTITNDCILKMIIQNYRIAKKNASEKDNDLYCI